MSSGLLVGAGGEESKAGTIASLVPPTIPLPELNVSRRLEPTSVANANVLGKPHTRLLGDLVPEMP